MSEAMAAGRHTRRSVRKKGIAGLAIAASALGACADGPLDVGTTSLISVTPAPASAGISPVAAIEVRFDGPVATGGGWPIALQVGDCPGPVVMGTWSRTADGMGLTFEPSMPLADSTLYTIHVGGGIADGEGAAMDLESRGPTLGGMWVTESMVMGMGSMGMGMTSHATDEWRDPRGTYGLGFSFTTGS